MLECDVNRFDAILDDVRVEVDGMEAHRVRGLENVLLNLVSFLLLFFFRFLWFVVAVLLRFLGSDVDR